MKNLSDSKLAQLILEKRQHGAMTWWRYIKTNAWRLFVFFCVIALLLGLGTFAQAWGFCGYVIGLATGILSCNGVWLRQQREVWPFYATVIDWEKVERIAQGESAA